MILVLILTFKADVITAIAKGDLKMFRSEQDSNPDLCDTCTVDTVIYQLSYTSPTGEGLLCEFMITRWRWTIYVKSSIVSEAFSTVFHQLSYQVNWKRVIVWVHGNSWKMEVDVQYISKSYNWTAASETSLTWWSQFWTLFSQWVEETWKFQSSTEFQLWPLRNRFSR